MICTFGDTTDVTWWRELKLELRAIVDKAGRITEDMPHGIVSARGQQAYAQLVGKKVAQARETIVALLTESGELEGAPATDDPPGQALGERHQAAGDRDQPAMVYPLPP